jgi:hypothetical protein
MGRVIDQMLISPPQPVPLVADVVGILIVGLLVYQALFRLTPNWNLTARGWDVVRAGAAIASGFLAYGLIWPAIKWLWQARRAPDWYWNLIDSDGFDVLVGAFLATAGGMLALWWQEWHRKSSARNAFNTLVRWELLYNAPHEHGPHFYDPPTARRITLHAIPRLLDSGVLDPHKDEDLSGELTFMLAVVQSFNDRARTFDSAWGAGLPQPKLQKLSNDLQMSYMDYREAHENVVAMLWRLGDPPPTEEEEFEALGRETPRKWARKRLEWLGLVESSSVVWRRGREALRRELARYYPEKYRGDD